MISRNDEPSWKYLLFFYELLEFKTELIERYFIVCENDRRWYWFTTICVRCHLTTRQVKYFRIPTNILHSFWLFNHFHTFEMQKKMAVTGKSSIPKICETKFVSYWMRRQHQSSFRVALNPFIFFFANPNFSFATWMNREALWKCQLLLVKRKSQSLLYNWLLIFSVAISWKMFNFFSPSTSIEIGGIPKQQYFKHGPLYLS